MFLPAQIARLNGLDCDSGALVGGFSPVNKLTLVKNGAGNPQLTGTNGCARGGTINNRTLTYDDGYVDWPVSDPITNHAVSAAGLECFRLPPEIQPIINAMNS